MRRLHVVWFLALVITSGCTRSTPGAPDELPILARWIEDQAHGLSRRAGELELDGASTAMQRAVTWAVGDDLGADRWRSPPPISARAARWPAVAGALRNGWLLIDVKQGLLGPAPTLKGEEFALAADLADAENHDRRRSDLIVLARAAVDDERNASFQAATLAARLSLDAAAGGKPWVSTAPPPLAP